MSKRFHRHTKPGGDESFFREALKQINLSCSNKYSRFSMKIIARTVYKVNTQSSHIWSLNSSDSNSIFTISFSSRIAVILEITHPTRIAAVYPYLQPEGTLKSLGSKHYVYHLLSRLGFWSTHSRIKIFPKALINIQE